jgi:hypothetical protein
VFNMFEELFAPGRKHTHDERKRLELSRVDVNDGDPGRGPIDLASGKVVVRAPRQEHGPDHRPGPEPASGPTPDRDHRQGPEPETDPVADPDTDPDPEPKRAP